MAVAVGQFRQSIKVNPSKTMSITNSLASLLSEDPELKEMAQKAFTSYYRSIYLQSNKNIFDVKVTSTHRGTIMKFRNSS